MKKIIRTENGRTRVVTINNETTKTQQQFKDQCDINHIMAKYKLTGQIQHIQKNTGYFLDHSEIPDYQTALNTVIQAQDSFMSLPSDLRKKFGNDPQQLLEFLSDSKNRDEAERLGLINLPPAAPPTADVPTSLKPNDSNDKKQKKGTTAPEPDGT